MYDWKAGEKQFITHLTLNGPTDQRKVAEAYNIVPATINLAKNRLIERGYIRLGGTMKIGRGAPRKIYVLTPAGLIAAVLEGELWGRIDEALKHWEYIAPAFIKRYETLREWGFDEDAREFSRSTLAKNKLLIETIGKAADNLTCYMPSKDVVNFTTEKDIEGYRLINPWKGLLGIIDRGFYTEMYKRHWASTRTRYLQMVKSDQPLRRGWLRWFEGKEERFRKLKEHRKIILNKNQVNDEKSW